MLNDFQLTHWRKPHGLSLSGPLVWDTCLRTITISQAPKAVLDARAEVYQERDAYRFLLEVICGLHSPVVGETEVFGQFKGFAQNWLRHEPERARLVQRLFAEAKEIRSRHLRHLGTQSYGSWLRRRIGETRVHLVGAGQLAREIVPHLIKIKRDVLVHAREPMRAKLTGVPVLPLSGRHFDRGSVIVAAPIAAADVGAWLTAPPAEIFDLRETALMDSLAGLGGRVVSLHEIFSEIERSKARLRPIVDTVKGEIAERSERAFDQAHVRPQGWDDICA